MKPIKWVMIVVFMLGLSGLSHAQQQQQPPEPEPIIELTPDVRLDKNINKRISGIFSDFEELQKITVAVDGGIVTLGGEVANEASAQKALSLTKRLEGVISVNDEITRTLKIRENVEPILEGAKDKSVALYNALPLIGLALLIMAVILFLFDRLARFTKLWRWAVPNPYLAEFVAQALRIIGFIIGAVIALNLLGASNFIGFILGGAGVLGLSVGFAVRDALENYVASIMLSVRQPFRANDHVVISDKEGIVVRLTTRATILMTMDGNHLRIPNSMVFKGIILNYSTNPERRFDFTLGIDTADNPVIAMQSGIDVLTDHDFILDDPKPGAVIKSVGDSNIVIGFTGWVNQKEADFFRSRSLAIESVMRTLEAQGFSLPEPIYRVRMQDDSPVTKDKARDKEARIEKAKDEALEDIEAAEVFDTTPDTHLTEKVLEERKDKTEDDLLDTSRPTE